MDEKVKDEFIGFRITREDMEKVQQRAQMRGQKIADWCRSVVLSEARKDFSMTANERMIFEQSAVIRHMLGRYLRLVLPPEAFSKLQSEVERHQIKIADRFLEKRLAMKDPQGLKVNSPGTESGNGDRAEPIF